MKDLLAQFISKLNTFDENEITAIVENTQIESFKKGTLILEEGKICNKCYFVLKGCIRQYQLVNGEEKTTGFFMEGQAAVLYSSYLNKSPSKYYLSCIEDSVLTTGTREQEELLHKQYPKLEYLVHSLMPQDYTVAQERISLLNNHSPEERYIIIMKTQPELFRRVPLHYIASYIGVTPESFSRIRKRVLLNDKTKDS
ncbi:Crp/Fnr family transcriptional regulator [Flavivirga eckloniae]|uniref:Cyclic nucleotide-binding protein n=1 Tax=Flavivirga eckloniae TaxID=1803846 RepID=A0A2K9PNE4_9FLAO|nr:Crp/Fnr family transcriptional regulator [Flavivirga eckloniae]AUP78572.1 cyclic nucleotide-binding protein [Flavivirga eckloniae]